MLFANFAEAMAEARGKAQADTLRATQNETPARRVSGNGTRRLSARPRCARATSSSSREGEIIPGDGEVIEGVAYVNEAAITGESAPVLKEPGTDIRSSVTGGTQVVSDWLRIRITADPGETLPRPHDRAGRGRRAPEDAERDRAHHPAGRAHDHLPAGRRHARSPSPSTPAAPVSTVILVALLVCLIPTTIGGLLSAIGIAGMDRVTRYNVLAMSGRAVEAAGDVDTLLLDKTGTITFGNRLAAEFIPVGGATPAGAGRSPRCSRPWATRRRRAAASWPSPSSSVRTSEPIVPPGAELDPLHAPRRA